MLVDLKNGCCKPEEVLSKDGSECKKKPSKNQSCKKGEYKNEYTKKC